MTDLRDIVDSEVRRVRLLPADTSFLDGFDGPPHIDGAPGTPAAPFNNNSVALLVSREDAIVHGLVEPTPQERAVMAERSEYWRRDRAAREVRRADWFDQILTVAGPVGAAVLALHTPDEYGDCEGCGFTDMAGLAWPCKTVLAGAEAAGVPEVAGL